MPYRILVVDDDPVHRLVAEEVLSGARYRVVVVPDGAQGLQVLADTEIDVVVTDRRMPGMAGDEFCRRVRHDLGLRMLPILMVTGSVSAQDLNESLRAGADDFLRKPYHPVELRARVDSAAQRKRFTDQLDSTESTLFALARMVEAKDSTTGDHCTRLAGAAMRFGQALGLPVDDQVALQRGGVLHDIGKLGIPDAILLKPGALSADEWQVMRQHTTIGFALVAQLKSMRRTAPIIRHHHERWDGSGYPDGLAGEQIPLLARVFQLVDIHDALTCERPYKQPMPLAQANAMIQAEADRGWRDPALTRAFLQFVGQRRGASATGDDGADDLGRTLYEQIAVASPA